MKKILGIVLLIAGTSAIRAQLNYGPFEFNTSITGEFANNFYGGLKQGYTFIGVEQFSVNFSTDLTKLWKGGNLFVHILNTHGTGPTQKLVGDMMYLSNIEAGNHLGLFEFWLSQRIGNFEFLVGQHDMNTEFAGTKYGENFLNSSYGIISNVSLNVPVSTFPVATYCILGKYYFSDQLVFKATTYNGDPGNTDNNKFGIHWRHGKETGMMNLAELQYTQITRTQNGIHTSKGIQTGLFKLGFYYHSATFFNYADTNRVKTGNYGIYFIADKMIVPKPSKPDEGIATLLEVGFSPSEFNLINFTIEAGIRYHGILPRRTHDFVGVAFSYASLSNYVVENNPEREKVECSIEVSYKFQFGKYYTIQPDFQYIIHPGAINAVPNACIGLLRFQLAL